VEIEEAIVTRLAAQVPSLSGKIYPAFDAPENIPLPYCTYQRISTSRYETLTEAGSFEPVFQFNIYNTTYTNMRSLRKSVRQAFEDVLGEYAAGAPYVQRVTIESEFDGYDTETDAHSGILEISFFYN
jgi:hypothetical protein